MPISQSEQLADALASVGTPVEFVRVDGANHMWRDASATPDRAAIMARSIDFLRALAGPKA